MDLKDYVAATPKETRCHVCNLPAGVRIQVEEGYKEFSIPTINKWLKGEGHTVGLGPLRNHRRDHYES